MNDLRMYFLDHTRSSKLPADPKAVRIGVLSLATPEASYVYSNTDQISARGLKHGPHDPKIIGLETLREPRESVNQFFATFFMPALTVQQPA